MFKFKKEDDEKNINEESIKNLIKKRLNYLPESVIKMKKKNNKKLNEMIDYLKIFKMKKKIKF